jgi:mono/diheme cytochrome c family protein
MEGVMRTLLKIFIGTTCASFIFPTFAQNKPEQKIDFGKREFEANCATCHGVTGKGNGPITDLLKKSPPDLTQLTKKNNGVFPMERLYNVIEGEGADVAAHGPRDMPIWGRDYKTKAAEYYMDAPYDPEAYSRARILALLEYINRLQAK